MEDIATRIENAMAFLTEHPLESKTCISRMFKIPYTYLNKLKFLVNIQCLNLSPRCTKPMSTFTRSTAFTWKISFLSYVTDLIALMTVMDFFRHPFQYM